MAEKIKTLVGKIDCPSCLSLIQWTDSKDIKIANGNQYIICPECGEHIVLQTGVDYWVEE